MLFTNTDRAINATLKDDEFISKKHFKRVGMK